MKKLFLSMLALAGMVACNNDVIVDVPLSQVITFEDMFVENKTRAAVDPSFNNDTTPLKAFDVWGYMDETTGTVFDAERVEYDDAKSKWTYDPLQYWMTDREHNYYFYAVAPVDNTAITVNKELNGKGLGTIDFTNENGTVDLLYAEKHVPVVNGQTDVVKLQFAHLLSKVKFTFKNGFPEGGFNTLKVENITISEAPSKGTVILNADARSWEIKGNGATLNFGNVNTNENGDAVALNPTETGESDFERLTIPAANNVRYKIDFHMTLYQGSEVGMESSKTLYLEGQAFEMGKNYNLVATITADNFAENALNPIEFDVEVDEWVEGTFEGAFDEGNDEPVKPELVALAAPVVKAEVAQNIVTLTWNAIDGASHYTVQVDDDVEETVNDTTYVFEGDYEYEYTFTVKAIAADTTKNLNSEAAVVKATTEAEPVVEEKILTVAEFLAAEVDDTTYYTLKGTITRVANTNYGNFDLTDETGTVYVYGLYSEDGATDKYWAASGAKLGDDIVISALRSEFNGSAQAGSARFVELTSPGTRAFWTFSKDALTFGSAAAEQSITIEAYNLNGNVNVSSDNAQFTGTYTDGVLTVSALENTSTENITGNITVTAGTLEKVIPVTQSGVSGGTEVTAEATMADFGWANSATVKEAKIDDNVTVTFAQDKASNPPAFYTSGNAVRLYQNGATMTVTANGKTIKSMEITFAQNHYYMAPDCGEFSAEAETRTWTGDATEVKFTTTGTDKNHRAYIAAIKVTYVE